MIETAERSGMSAGLGMWRRKAVPRWREASAAGKATTMKSTGAIEVVAIHENSAVRYVGVVVVNDAVVMPIVAPAVPAPAKPAKEADSKAEAKSNSRTGKEQSWVRIPARPDPDRLPIREPRVILRNVNNLRVGWFDHNSLPLLAHLFLRCAL